MNDISISEKITYSTVQIKCDYSNNTSGSGTGFIIHLCHNKDTNECVSVLITNKHVVRNSIKTVFEFCKSDKAGNPLDKDIFSFTLSGNSWINHPDPEVDLCCLPLAPILKELEKRQINIFYIPLQTDLIPSKKQVDDLAAIEDLVMVGYPIGLSDAYNHKPILRKGITATHLKKDYQGKKEFLLDMACFPGSSGSPIFILNQGTFTTVNGGIVMGNRIHFVGVLYGGPQYSTAGTLNFANLPNMPVPVVNIPTNLGIAIKSERVLDFEKYFAKDTKN